MQRQKGRVIEQQLIGKRRIETVVKTRVNQFLRESFIAGHAGLGNAQPFLVRSVVVPGAADAKSRHAVEKKVRPVLHCERNDGIRLGCGEALAQPAIVAEKIVRLFFGRGFRPSGHSGRVARRAGKYDRHGLLQSFERFCVIFVGNFVQQGERSQQ